MCLVPNIYVIYGVQIVHLIGALMKLECSYLYLSFIQIHFLNSHLYSQLRRGEHPLLSFRAYTAHEQ